MTLLVDFNMMDLEGRVLALVAPEQQPFLRVGDVVDVIDDEGNRSRGTIEELTPAARGPQTLAHLALTRSATGPAADAPSRT